MTDPLSLLTAYVLGTIAVARAARLVTSDPYPPMQAIRLWWIEWQDRRDWIDGYEHSGITHGWAKLVTCPFCASPYITAVALAAAIWADVWQPDLGSLHGWWLILAVWASGSYLAAMVVLRDEPPAED